MSSVPNPPSVAEFRDWSIAAVRLLQGVVYSDDSKVWDALLRGRSNLESHFARIGLSLVVDESEGFAYVRQWSDEECPDGYDQLPKLVRRVPLGYGPTLLAVLFRDELRRHEEEVHHERCVVEADLLFEHWKAFFPHQPDEFKQRKEFTAAVNKLSDLGFVRKFGENPEQWEVRAILKARLPAAELENLRSLLLTVVNQNAARGGTDVGGGSDDA